METDGDMVDLCHRPARSMATLESYMCALGVGIL